MVFMSPAISGGDTLGGVVDKPWLMGVDWFVWFMGWRRWGEFWSKNRETGRRICSWKRCGKISVELKSGGNVVVEVVLLPSTLKTSIAKGRLLKVSFIQGKFQNCGSKSRENGPQLYHPYRQHPKPLTWHSIESWLANYQGALNFMASYDPYITG